MASRFSDWPKIELHRHIEGCMRVGTFIELARDTKMELPGWDEETARGLIQLNDSEKGKFDGFIRTFRWLRHVLRTREALQRTIYEAVADAAGENIRYLELRFNPGAMFTNGMEERDVISAVREGVRFGERDYHIKAACIGIIGRDMPPELYKRSLEFCIKYRGEGIDGIDLAGIEIAAPEGFVPVFKRAKDAGLFITIHAGEIAGAENIINSVEMLGADRIGHGTHLFELPEAVQCVRDHGVMIETCLTSNVCTGAVRSIKEHPLRRMIECGVSVSINADDPAVCWGLTLNEEYRVATEELGLSDNELKSVIVNSLEYIFRPELKEELKKEFVF